MSGGPLRFAEGPPWRAATASYGAVVAAGPPEDGQARVFRR